jgi:hypothetical protein
MPVSISGTNGVTFPDSSLQAAAASPYVLKNRIINGDCRIDQRNAGASVTANDDVFILDRWITVASVASKMTGQQNAASVTPPAGFTNYLGITSSSSYTAGAAEIFAIRQKIEGYNVSDLDFGKATAKTITFSFWVRSSLTGTFGGALMNSAGNRCYPFTYTISVANTWEQKTVTVAGDTSGTWLTTNGVGLSLVFNLGTGTTYSGTANAWSSNLYYSATGATSVVSTNGATWYITGVQLEIGSSATPFERRLYNQELANCQRYYETGYPNGTAPANGAIGYFDGGSLGTTAYATNAMRSLVIQFCVEKRTTPIVTLYNIGIGGISANFWAYYNGAWANYNSASGISQATAKCFSVRSSSTSTTGVAYMIEGNWAASAEL